MRKLFLVIISFFVVITAFAQANTGSPYSRYGIGDININPSTKSQGMGNIGYTLTQQSNINNTNPASIADIDSLTFIFYFGLEGGYRTYSIEYPAMKRTCSDYQIAFLNFGFSLNKYWKMAFGLNPYSSAKYNISAKDSAYNISKTYKYEGSGGVNKIFLTNAFSVAKNLKLGITTSYLFGEMYQNSSIKFDNDTTGFLSIMKQNINRISDFTFDLGVKYNLNINNKNKTTIGLFYGHNKDLRSFQSSLTQNKFPQISYTDTLFYSEEVKGKISLPQTFGIGFGYNFDEKLFMGIDFTVQNWKNAKFFDRIDSLGNGTFLSFGTEYHPAGNENVYNFWQAASYRFGAYYNTTQINLSGKQTPINDFGITFGVNLPMKRSRTSFDISVKTGQRGSFNNGLIKENYTIIGIGFNLADRWFIKSKFD